MRWKALAGVLTALAFLVPAAPASAQAAEPGRDEKCRTVERHQYKDLRTLITIDLNTATDTEVRVISNQILSAARADSLPTLPDQTQKALDGPAEELRAFLKTGMEKTWFGDLSVLVSQTIADGGPHVKEAARKTLDDNTIEAALAFLNNGLYEARELDCRAQPTATPSRPAPANGSLPRTGAAISVLVVGGVFLVAFGLGTVLLARRSRV